MLNQPNAEAPIGGDGRTMRGLIASPLRAWSGDAPLGQVFWGYGVFVSVLLITAFLGALHRNDIWVQEALLLAFLAYTVWILTAIWRCSEAGTSVWHMIARLLTITWAANTLLVAGFLQLNLLETALGL